MSMTERYSRRAKHGAMNAAVAAISALLCWAYASAMYAEESALVIALAIAGVLAVFIACTQIAEAIRCARLFRQWKRWEAEAPTRL